jgi:hypothetical protein
MEAVEHTGHSGGCVQFANRSAETQSVEAADCTKQFAVVYFFKRHGNLLFLFWFTKIYCHVVFFLITNSSYCQGLFGCGQRAQPARVQKTAFGLSCILGGQMPIDYQDDFMEIFNLM